MNNPPRAAVILFPGSNREGDVVRALRQASGAPPAIVWHDDRALPAGNRPRRLARRFFLRRLSALRRDRRARARSWTPCAPTPRAAGWSSASATGSRFLCEAGLLPGVLMRNAGRRFICRMQHLRVENDATPFTRGYARGPGDQVRHRARRRQLHHRLLGARRSSSVRAASLSAIATPPAPSAAPANPNGSTNDIAGVYNKGFNVLGLMPHPENLIDPLVGGIDGRAMFRALAAA